MRPTRDRALWFLRGVICFVGVVVLSLPAQALADGLTPSSDGDIIDGVTDTVDGVTDEVDEVVEDVPVPDDVGGAVDDVTDDVGGAVDDVTDDVGGAVDDVTEGAGDAVEGVADTPGEAVGSSPVPPSSGGREDGAAEPGPPTSGSGRDSIGFPSPVGEGHLVAPVVDRPYTWALRRDAEGLWTPTAQTVEDNTDPSEVDPCSTDDQLVCLGLLYGLGEFVDIQAKVLSFLAMTGLGVIGLTLLAFGLAIAGSMALVGSRHRSTATVGRAR